MLVELLPRRGARVRALLSRELLDLYDIRIRLEPLGAYEAAQAVAGKRPSPYSGTKGKEKLEIALVAYREAVATDISRVIKRADYEFHQTIVELSGNELLQRLIKSSNIVFISNQRGLLKAAQMSLAEHEELFTAIASGDAERSAAIMELHLLGARVNLASHVAQESVET